MMKTSRWLAVIVCAMLTDARAAVPGARQFREFQVPSRPDHVDLLLDVPAGIAAPAGYPVTTGVPFADGWLKDTTGLRVETADGRAVPAQFEVRGRWPRSGNVRWLGVDFQLVRGATGYRLAFGKESGPAHAEPVRVGQKGPGFIVSTGPLTVEIPGAGPMFSRAWLGQELVLEQRAGDGNWLTTPDGARHVERAEKAVLERTGPLHATVRVDGAYVDPQGKPSCKWTARLHFYAGRPEIGITHTFTWIGRADQFRIRDLAISFGLAKPATEAAADKSDETLGESVSRPLRTGEMLSLLQDEHWHWGHGESHFGILAGNAAQPQEIASGKKAGSWVGVSDGRLGVTLALRELWQQFPKELRAEPDRLTAYLWSSHGKSGPCDLSYDSLEKFWGEAVVAQLRETGQDGAQYKRARANPASNDPTGVAKTHDLLLVFHPGAAAGAAAMAEAFDAPPVVLPDPRWTMESDAIGRLWPKDEQRFPEWEKYINATWTDAFRVLDDWGDYGFFGYGDAPHQRYDFKSGRAVASIWRYTQAADYGVHKAAWLGWLRSGDRRFYDFAVARTRFLNDIVLCHEDAPTRWKGCWTASIAPIPWGTAGGIRSQAHTKVGLFEFFIEHALIHYYLTGDQRSLDVAGEYATALREMTSMPDWAKTWVSTMNDSLSRWYFHRIEDLAVCYEQFGDRWFHDKAVELADFGIDLNDSGGIVRDAESGKERKPSPKYPSYIFYKAPNLLNTMRALDGPESEKLRQAFVKMAEHSFRTQSIEFRSIGRRMAYAYYFTKDPRYLAFGLKGLDAEMRHSLERGPGVQGYATAVQHSGAFRASAVNALENAAHLMAALAECPNPTSGPPGLLLLKHLPWPAVEFAFWKEAGKLLTIELSASAATFTGPDGKPMPEAWFGPAITYYAHNDGIRLLDSDLPLLYRTITVPANAPAGEVRIRVDKAGMAYVFSTTATRAVMIAPDGFQIGGGVRGTQAGICLGGGHDERWHFLVPQTAARFRFASTSAERPTIRNPQGAVVEPKPLGDGSYEITVPTDTAGKLWSVSADGSGDVRFADIVPAFVRGKPEFYFTPAGVQVKSDLPAAAQARESQPRPRQRPR